MAAPVLPPRKTSLRTRLHAGEKLYGGILVTQTPYFAEMMGLAGYDYVVVDLQDGSGETNSALECLRALEAVDTPAIIRVGFNDQALLKKALNLGPSGVIVPMVQNREKAAFAVSCCRYPPVGMRGAHPYAVRATKFGLDKSTDESKELLLICQIESPEAVDLIPEIAGVDGVDGLMIAFDDPTSPQLAALTDKAEKAVLASPRKVFLKGIARPDIDPPPALYKRGYDIVSGTMDVVLFTTAALADIRAHKPLPLALSSTPAVLSSNGALSSNDLNTETPFCYGTVPSSSETIVRSGSLLASAFSQLTTAGDASANGDKLNEDDNAVHTDGDILSRNVNVHVFAEPISTS